MNYDWVIGGYTCYYDPEYGIGYFSLVTDSDPHFVYTKIVQPLHADGDDWPAAVLDFEADQTDGDEDTLLGVEIVDCERLDLAAMLVEINRPDLYPVLREYQVRCLGADALEYSLEQKNDNDNQENNS